jgi:ATP-dependent RNA helicase DeaD
MSVKTDHPPIPEAFAQLGIRSSILRALADAQFTTPSDIQRMMIPRALAGVDLLGQARTGTGKTAAFAIPILAKAEKGLATQAIILVPTRELCMQVETEVVRLGKHTPIRTVAVYGGQRIAAQMKFLRHGPEILVGTPGRVIDLLDRRIIDFANIRFVVLDEVDRMLDIGFRDDIRNILSRIRGLRRAAPSARDPSDQPSDHQNSEPQRSSHQTMFVSATISPEIEKLSRQYMREPVEKLIVPGADDKPTVAEVAQYYFSVEPWDKYRLLRLLLDKENPDLVICFCRTKRGAEKLARKLHADGFECREIHGNLAQNRRERVMKNFRGGKFDLLIATDLASRGIDVADISHIINYDLPEDPEVYVHRVGRTARMGAAGKAFSFVTREQGQELTRIEALINMIIPPAPIEEFKPSPPPSDWLDHAPTAANSTPAATPKSRFDLPYGSSSTPASSPTAGGAAADPTPVVLSAPPRTIGSKIPLSRRHKRRR